MCHKHLDKSVLMHLFKFPFTNTKIIIQYRLTYVHQLNFMIECLQVFREKMKDSM